MKEDGKQNGIPQNSINENQELYESIIFEENKQYKNKKNLRVKCERYDYKNEIIQDKIYQSPLKTLTLQHYRSNFENSKPQQNMYESFLNKTQNELDQSIVIRKNSMSSEQTTFDMIADSSIGMSESMISSQNQNSISSKFKFGNSPVNKHYQFNSNFQFTDNNPNQEHRKTETKKVLNQQNMKITSPDNLKSFLEQLQNNHPQFSQSILGSIAHSPQFENKLQELLINGKNELCFINQDPNQIHSFLLDSFIIMEQEKLDQAINLFKKSEDNLQRQSTDENLLEEQDLYKEIEQQEIDFDQGDSFIDDEQLDQQLFQPDETQVNQMADATKKATQMATSIQQYMFDSVKFKTNDLEDFKFEQDQQGNPIRFEQEIKQRKIQIEQINEVDEEYMEDESQFSNRFPTAQENNLKLLQTKSNQINCLSINNESIQNLNLDDSDPDINPQIVDQSQTQQIRKESTYKSPNKSDKKYTNINESVENNVNNQLNSFRIQKNKKLNFYNDESDSSSSDQLQNSKKSSQDSIDEQWQTCFKQHNTTTDDQSHTGFQFQDQEIEVTKILENPEDVKVNIAEFNEENLEKIKEESALQHQKLVESLISFDFLTTSRFNKENINLKNYQVYFKDQMHLAPTTDSRSSIIIGQITDCLYKNQNSQNIENYQELGCAGFYGIPNDPEIIISMLLLTNSFDQFDLSACFIKQENLIKPISLFNNPQQYLFPHSQFQLLQKALKKIILNVKDKQTQIDEENFYDNLITQLDFGILLLLGKMYFHVCKYRQAIHSFKLAIQKCKLKQQINTQDIQEGLMWLAIVYQMYISNKLRNFKMSIAQHYQKSQRENQIQQSLLHQIVNFQELDEDIIISQYQQYLAINIYENCESLDQTIQEFLTFSENDKDNYMKLNNKLIIVLFINLKHQMFLTSPIFNYFQIIVNKKIEQINKVKSSLIQESQIFEQNVSIDISMQQFSRESNINQKSQIGQTPQSKISFSQKLKNFFGQRQKQTDQALKQSQIIKIQEETVIKRQTLKVIKNEKEIIKNLYQLAQQMQRLDNCIGQLALIEIEIWKQFFDHYQNQEINFIQKDNKLKLQHIQKSIEKLNLLAVQNKNNMLPSIKLWQVYAIQGQIQYFENGLSDCLEQAHETAESISNQIQTSVQNNFTVISEKEIIITLILCKSLFHSHLFKDCFEKLQLQYIKNSNYSSLLYLYGKYIIKSQKINSQESQEAVQFFGSGIGALEECLKTCVSEFQGRIYFYIGLAYSFSNRNTKMPIKTLNYWKEAITQIQKCELSIQGLQKQKIIQRYIDQYQFIDLIIDLINQSLKQNEKQNSKFKIKIFDGHQIDAQQIILANQYLQVLTQFQEKVDSPSCLLLKAHIYAHTLKIQEEAQKCFQQVIDNHPEIIPGYLEYWDYMKTIYKQQKQEAKQKYQMFKQNKDSTFKIQALKMQQNAKQTLQCLKQIIKKAIFQSNKCTHVSTSEWVQVRIIASKTYIIEKEINKAIDILTDLCYIIPQNMLQIGKDSSNLVCLLGQCDGESNYQECGGIRFCEQILIEEDDKSMVGEQIDQNQNSKGKGDKFKNRIFIYQDQEQEILDDFDNQTLRERNSLVYQNQNSLFENQQIDFRFTERDEERQKDIFETSQYINDLEGKSKWNFTKFGKTNKDHIRESLVSNSDFQFSEKSTNEMLFENKYLQNQDEDRISEQRAASNFDNESLRKQRIKGIKIDNFNKIFETNVKTQFASLKKDSNKKSIINRSSNQYLFRDKQDEFDNNVDAQHLQTQKKAFPKFDNNNNSLHKNQIANQLTSPKNKINKFDQQNDQQQKVTKFQVQQKEENKIFQPFDCFLSNEESNLRIDKKDKNYFQKDIIFAVNSDVYFLYMIGKFCLISGQNLFQGLLALNDYYLFVWHNCYALNEQQDLHNQVSPLKSLLAKMNKQNRIKECIKTLLLMGQIYEKLHQPLLAIKLYFKIMEDRETMSKYFSCKKQIEEADKGIGRIWKNLICWVPLGGIVNQNQQIDSFHKKIEIQENHFI